MSEPEAQEGKKTSLLDSISKAAAVFGALIAVGQAGTTWLNKTPYGRTLGTSEVSSGTSSLCG